MRIPPLDSTVPLPKRQRALRASLRLVVANLALVTSVTSCAPPLVPPERISKVEVRNLTSSEKMIEGDDARKLFEGMTCHEGDFKWRGGYPATLYLDNGRDREVDGFSYYERVLRISSRQYCELGEKQWKAVFGELLKE
jgi:hypothetical protein